AGGFVDQHDLRAEDRAARRLEVLAVARRPHGGEWPAQMVDVIIGDLPATVEALIYNDGLLIYLREEIALEVLVAQIGGVWNIDIGHAAAGGAMHLLEVALNPIAISQGGLVGQRLDGDCTAVLAVGVRADSDFDALVGRVLKERVERCRRLD